MILSTAAISDYRNLDQVLANRYFIIVANEWLNYILAFLISIQLLKALALKK